MTSAELDAYLTERKALCDGLLSEWLPRHDNHDEDPGQLLEAMRYAALSGGKRLRPILTLAAFEACGGKTPFPSVALRAACALELVHCYSLVHDDLPAMDDDAMRRGKPTVHRAFNEATAVLVGDALLTLAFEWVAEAGVKATRTLARCAGPMGMIKGQARDIALGGAKLPLDLLERLWAEKTGALFVAATEVGALCADALPRDVQTLGAYGRALGVLFQYADDLEDGELPAGEVSPLLRSHAQSLLEATVESVRPLGASAEVLVAIAQRVGQRALQPTARSTPS